MIPTLPQPFPQPETKEPTSNEIAPDDPNQEYMATETHESKPHSIPATEPPSEPPPHGIATSTSPLMTEPVLPQSETPMTPLDSVTREFNPHAAPTTETQFQPTAPSPQSVTSIVPPPTLPDQIQPTTIPKPANWHDMNARQKSNWLKRNKGWQKSLNSL